jgi:hypothetical protein
VTASEFAFLALGLVLGVATGAALVEVLRARPPAAREIRVTVAPHSIHARRAATLADDAFPDEVSGPARGGPADRRWVDRDDPRPDAGDEVPTGGGSALDAANRTETASIDRTIVRVPAALPPSATVPGATGANDHDARGSQAPEQADFAPFRFAAVGSEPAGMVAVPMSLEPDPLTSALRATAAAVATAAMRTAPVRTPAVIAIAGEEPIGRSEVEAQTAGSDASPASGQPGPAPAGAADAGPCGEERRVADERCAVADRARESALAAAETLRSTQREYDDHVSQAEAQASTVDPRAVRSAKEQAQHRFREDRLAARTQEAVEAAARTWLEEINRINQETRDSHVRLERHRAAAARLGPSLERLALESDAARISADMAAEACIAAREAVAACEEAQTRREVAAAAAAPAAPETARGDGADTAYDDEEVAAMGSRAAVDAPLLRMLRGDRDALQVAATRLAGDDADAHRQWQRALGSLVDALIARAIEASALDFPVEHDFWGRFTLVQNRDIASALSSLGYRFDGFGDWVDEHVPNQRDLAMAVGYAGLDPMRIRHWPSDAEARELLRDVRVAADEYVADAAGGLTLGELVTLLGRRADDLAELWNQWGAVRPLLLEAY